MYKTGTVIIMVCRSLRQRKLRSALSILGVIFGVMAVVTMVSIGEGAKHEALRKIERLGVKNIYIRSLELTSEEQLLARQKLSPGLCKNDVQAIKSLSKMVDEVTVYHEIITPLQGTSLAFTPKVAACSINYADIYKLNLQEGRFFSVLDVRNNNNVCVLGGAVAKKLGRQGRVGGKLRLGDMLVTVVGILAEQGLVKDKNSVLSLRDHDGLILLPQGLEHYLPRLRQQKTAFQPNKATELIVKIKKEADANQAAQEIGSILDRLHNNVSDYQIIVPEQLLVQIKQTRKIFNIVLGSIAAVSLLVGGIGIMNIMLATVTERTREIGIRRAVGARRFDISLHFLLESCILTLVGGLAGIVFGIAATRAVSYFASWPTVITWHSILLPFTISCLVGIFFGFYPARRAACLSPIVALRQD